MTDEEKLTKTAQLESWAWDLLEEHTEKTQWITSRNEWLLTIDRCQRIRANLKAGMNPPVIPSGPNDEHR